MPAPERATVAMVTTAMSNTFHGSRKKAIPATRNAFLFFVLADGHICEYYFGLKVFRGTDAGLLRMARVPIPQLLALFSGENQVDS